MAFSGGDDFQLPIQNALNIARFSVDKILDTVLAQDNKIYYKVKWQDTWEPEDRMSHICAQQIADFWKEYQQRIQQQANSTSPSTSQSSDNTKQLQQPNEQESNPRQNSLPSLPTYSSTQQSSSSLSIQNITSNVLNLPKSQLTDGTSRVPIINGTHQTPQNITAQQPQPFQSVTQLLASSQNESTATTYPPMLSSVNSLMEPQPPTPLSVANSPAVEFQIQEVGGDKNTKTQSQNILVDNSTQQKFLAPTNQMLRTPGFHFLPNFTSLGLQSLHQAQQQSNSTQDPPSQTPSQRAQRQHKPTKKHICNVCSKEFKTNSLLKKHSVLHGPPVHYECQTCGKTFIRKTALKRHELCHQNDRPHKCHECGKGFKESSNLAKHVIIHSGERPHACDVCNARFRQLGHLLKHVVIHKPEKPYKCTSCDKAFKRKEHLRDHMIIHTGDFPFQCEFCDKKFRFKTNLKVHVMQHSGRKDFVCHICNKAFSGKASLTQHLVCHDPTHSFSCEVCQKRFSRKAHLKRHMDVHRNEPKLVCVFCKESFPDRASYKTHLLTHTGSKPFFCSICEKRFGAKSYLQQHLLTHSNDGGTFECLECHKKFHTQEILDKHTQKHLKEKTSPRKQSIETSPNQPIIKPKTNKSRKKDRPIKTVKSVKIEHSVSDFVSKTIEIASTYPLTEKRTQLNSQEILTREAVKEAVASLPIASNTPAEVDRILPASTTLNKSSEDHYESLTLPAVEQSSV
ncbi:zinc finger protein 665-like [Clytia hemisphaerica]|uniref:Zinc finger protein n=1 Tax=Clytia hemisphaerica TaxID=252671 RepID=A0A7M5WR12_9CNID|eukprot:TCONS_00001680-protein